MLLGCEFVTTVSTVGKVARMKGSARYFKSEKVFRDNNLIRFSARE